MVYLLPSPSGKVSLKATEGVNKSLLFVALRFIPYRLDFHFISSTHFPRRRKRRSFQKISIEREGKSEALSSKKVLLLLSFAMSEQKTSIVTFYNLFSVIALTILLIYAILRQKELQVLRRI